MKSLQQRKKKDPNKVDKKFLWPHGITPPLKNVRKRRFRKTLKKKYVEAPEIEKEVKRLLRVDNDAVKVTWEIINEEDDKPKHGSMKDGGNIHGGDASLEASNQHSVDVAEHDIFGEALSDSEEEETNINIMEMEDENSRLSADDTMDSTSLQAPHGSEKSQHPLVTQFSREMFGGQDKSSHSGIKSEIEHESERDYSRSFDHDQDHSNVMKEESTMDYDDDEDNDERPSSADQSKEPKFDIDTEAMSSDTGMFEQRRLRKEQLEFELPELRARCQQQELEISNLENQALRQRFQEKLDNMLSELLQKEQEYQELCHD